MVGVPQVPAAMLVAQSSEPTISEPLRAILLMALLGIVLLGLLLVVGTMLGAHWVRRLGRFRRGPAVPLDVAPLCSKRSPQLGGEPSQVLPAEEVETVISRKKRFVDDTIHSK